MTTNSTSAQDLRAILAAEPTPRARLIDAFVTERFPLMRRFAYRLCRTHALDVDSHSGEMLSLVTEVCVKMINGYIEDPSRLEATANFEGLLNVKCGAPARDYANSELGHAPASGMSNVMRRRAHIAKVREDMANALGADPAPRDLVDEANRRIHQTQADPARHGSIVSMSDLDVQRPGDIATHDEEIASDGGWLLDPTEGRAIVDKTLARAQSSGDPMLAAVATIWIGSIYAPAGGEVKGDSEIAAELEISRPRARLYVLAVRTIALQVVRDVAGLSEDDFAHAQD